MADLFQTSRTNVVEHIAHIYEECKLNENSTCRKFRQVRKEGNREVSREMLYYNLDMIISLGYRVKSKNCYEFPTLGYSTLEGIYDKRLYNG